jgi:DNA-binding transcriptional LysR family regulator
MTLDGLRDFVSVVRAASFAAAARERGAPKSTLSKRVADLEAALGRRLIERSTRGLRLTPEGAALYERARRLIADADEIARAMRDLGAAPAGPLRVAAPTLFGHAFMGRLAADYAARWPGTTVEVVFTDRAPDLIEEGFDAAIRVGAVEDAGLVARPFAEARTWLVASPAYLAAAPALAAPDDLARHHAVAFAPTGVVRPWRLTDGVSWFEVAPPARVTLGAMVAVADAAEAGAGIALVPDFLAAARLSSGRLMRALPGWGGAPAALSVVFPSRRNLSPRLRALVDLLVATFPGRKLDAAASREPG